MTLRSETSSNTLAVTLAVRRLGLALVVNMERGVS